MMVKLFRAIGLLSLLGLFILGNNPGIAYAAPNSDTNPHAAIDSYIHQKMQTLKIPGAALAIVKDNQIEYLQGYGVADSKGRAVTPQTPFMLASVSKSFTALAVMQLVEAGKVDLSAPVQKYLPWFRVADEKASAKITVRQLLNQTSGFSETDGNQNTLDQGTAADALVASMKRLNTTNLINTPGSAFEYSNINYGLLGAIVEAVSGQPYETYIRQNIFDPLDMKHSHTSFSEARADGASSGYYPFFGFPVIYDRLMPYSRVVTPWAGIFASAEDMAHYLIAQLNDGQYAGKTVLSAQGISTLHQPGIQIDKWTSYAMGWFVFPDFDLANLDKPDSPSTYTIPVSVYHEGTWASFRTIAILVPQSRTGLIMMMNTNDPAIESAFALAGWDVLALYYGKTPAYYPPSEDFIRQHARLVLSVVAILLIASLVWFLMKMRSWRKQPLEKNHRWRQVAGYGVLPLVVDLFLAWFLLVKEIPQTKTTILGGLRFSPDIYFLIVTILLFTLGWGLFRTILMLRTIFKRERPASSLKRRAGGGALPPKQTHPSVIAR